MSEDQPTDQPTGEAWIRGIVGQARLRGRLNGGQPAAPEPVVAPPGALDAMNQILRRAARKGRFTIDPTRPDPQEES